MAHIIDGKAFSAKLRSHITDEVSKLKSSHDITPGLAVILVGEDPASHVYVRNKAKQTAECGMNSYEHKLSANTDQDTLLSLIDQLNNDDNVHGILCQLPLPKHLDEAQVINAISPHKDVDGFHISNVGLLSTGQKSMVPCTPLGCLLMLRDHFKTHHESDLSGLNAVVLGRSNIVGKPMAQLLLGESCTVTIAHSRTQNIEQICSAADVVVAAVGRPEMINANWLKKGAVVIDVGINRVEAPDKGLDDNGNVKRKLVGDVDFESAKEVAGAITPVPGGVGPMTIACLLANTLTAACRIHGLADPEGLNF